MTTRLSLVVLCARLTDRKGKGKPEPPRREQKGFPLPPEPDGKPTCGAVRGGDFHGVRRDVGSVGASVLAGTGEGDALLVTGELYELAELLLRERLQRAPEILDVLIGFHQAHLVHGVRLRERRARCAPLLPSPFANPPRSRLERRGREGRAATPLSPSPPAFPKPLANPAAADRQYGGVLDFLALRILWQTRLGARRCCGGFKENAEQC